MQRAGLTILLLAAGNAFAHPGHGAGGWLSASLAHLLSEPDHLALILGPLVAVACWLGWRRVAKRRAKSD
jgi:hydrogenase/urease accessory protein HupE